MKFRKHVPRRLLANLLIITIWWPTWSDITAPVAVAIFFLQLSYWQLYCFRPQWNRSQFCFLPNLSSFHSKLSGNCLTLFIWFVVFFHFQMIKSSIFQAIHQRPIETTITEGVLHVTPSKCQLINRENRGLLVRFKGFCLSLFGLENGSTDFDVILFTRLKITQVVKDK